MTRFLTESVPKQEMAGSHGDLNALNHALFLVSPGLSGIGVNDARIAQKNSSY